MSSFLELDKICLSPAMIWHQDLHNIVLLLFLWLLGQLPFTVRRLTGQSKRALTLTGRSPSRFDDVVCCRYGLGISPDSLVVELALLGCEERVELFVLDSVEDQLPLHIFGPSQPLIRVHIELLRNGLQGHWQVIRLIFVESRLGPVVQWIMHHPRSAVV